MAHQPIPLDQVEVMIREGMSPPDIQKALTRDNGQRFQYATVHKACMKVRQTLGEVIDDMGAANRYKNSLMPKADYITGSATMWREWALLDAFLAGVDHGRKA